MRTTLRITFRSAAPVNASAAYLLQLAEAIAIASATIESADQVHVVVTEDGVQRLRRQLGSILMVAAGDFARAVAEPSLVRRRLALGTQHVVDVAANSLSLIHI